MNRRILLVLVSVAALACGDTPTNGNTQPVDDGANPDPKCNPLAAGDCLLPWPSSFYEQADPSTATKLRVHLPDGVMPSSVTGKPLSTDRLNQLDGFSPATFLVANLKARVSPTGLPAQDDFAVSVTASSPVQLLRYDTGERVPCFAEPDNNATMDEDQVLLVHPMVRLAPGVRYVVALVGLKDASGAAVHVKPFDALVAGHFSSSSRLASLKPLYDDLFAFLEKSGVMRTSLTFAWDFTTGSDTVLTSHLLTMRDTAFATWHAMDLGYTVAKKVDHSTDNPPDPHLWFELLGSYQVPTFLTDDTVNAKMNFDDQGMPKLRGVGTAKLVVHVPVCARTATKPLPVMVYGHGLLGDAEGEMSSGYQKQLIDRLCMIQVGTNWIGLSSDDMGGDDSINVATKVITDFSNFSLVTDKLQQAEVNFMLLARLAVTKLAADAALQQNGMPLVDTTQVYYFGISQGGIMGGTFMSLSPDVTRGALNVGAGEYSLLLTRSSDFADFKTLIDANGYPVQRDQEVALAASQSYWDWSDPITFAPYTIKNPLPGLDGKPLVHHVLLQESIGDAQVANVATRLVARTEGLPLLDPPIQMVWGIDVKPAPLDSAYTQWSVDPSPLPAPVNTPPKDNQAHEGARRIPQLEDQLAAFFTPTGLVTQTCGGMPCVYPSN